MRIKLPLIEIETEKDCPCSKYEEYEVKIKCAKTKLHCKYLLVIAVLICVWLFAVLTHANNSFTSQMSFASTIASIILSVLAIIMSITGEGKTEHIKDQLEATAKDIKESQKAVNEINKSVEKNLGDLNSGIQRLSEKIEDIPGKTAQQMNEFQNEKMRIGAQQKNINTRVSYKSWENQK